MTLRSWSILGLCLGLCQNTAIAGAPPGAEHPLLPSEAPTFKSGVNLILVPVVVRDDRGLSVGGLRREDFALFDKGKKQEISKFGVEVFERAGVSQIAAASTESAAPGALTEKSRAPFVRPTRYVAYVFDDVNMTFRDLAWVRDGAERNVRTLDLAARAAVFTTSGRTTLEFTDNREKLHEALSKLRPNPLARETAQTCPTMTYYMANMIVNGPQEVGDPTKPTTPTAPGNPALVAATRDVIVCRQLPDKKEAPEMARAAARQALAAGDYETEVTLSTLKQIVRHMGAMPGQRTVVLLSPGFLTAPEFLPAMNDVINFATRLNVTVNALDARGLYTDALDIDKQERDPIATQIEQQLARFSAVEERQPLAAIAEGTGGRLIERTNDIDTGLKQIASPPECVYMLGFSPRDLRPDGSFHPLKVTLATKQKYTVQARRGYFATRMFSDPQEQEKEEIQQALFAPDDIHDPAVETRTEYFKSPDGNAELDVLTHLDTHLLRLQKAGGRNANDLAVVVCVLDHNGAWVDGKRNTVTLRLLDATVERMKGPGMTVKTIFHVPPGQYAVRTVVRDASGDLMSAESSLVEVP